MIDTADPTPATGDRPLAPAPAAAPRLPGIPVLLAGQVRYQMRLLLGGSNALVLGIGLPVMLLLASNAGHSRLSDGVVAGYAVFGLTVIAYNTHGVSLVAAREAGILKRWRAAPLPRWCYFTGRILTTTLVAVIAAAATIGCGMWFYGIHLGAGAAASVLAALVLGALAWAAAATAFTAVIRAVDAAGTAFLLTYFPVVIVSGLFGTIRSLPHWLTTLASYLPAQPMASAVGYALRHGPGASAPPAHDLAVLAGWAVGGVIVAVAVFRWEPSRPVQRRGARAPR